MQVQLATLLLIPATCWAFNPHTSACSDRYQPHRYHVVRRVPASATAQLDIFSKLFPAKEEPKKEKELEETQGKEEAGLVGFLSRRALVVGVAAQPFLYLLIQALSPKPKPQVAAKPQMAAKPKMTQEEQEQSEFDQGYASVGPALEVALVETFENGTAFTGSPKVKNLVENLERLGGVQKMPAAEVGRWVMPWVGGWERIWISQMDATFIGGPTATGFTKGSDAWAQYSARHWVYGPGVGGVTTEYLYKPTTKKEGEQFSNRLLARAGVINNIGENVFVMSFPDALREFETETTVNTGRSGTVFEKDELRSDVPVATFGKPQPSCRLRTTYLSPSMWVIRDADNSNIISVYRRTEIRSVVDRRGLIAEYQVKPPEDDNIRFGGLLFSDRDTDYKGWDEKILEDESLTKKLLK